MAFIGNFDASQVEPAANFDPLPPGNYVAAIVESEMRDNQNGNGRHLWLAFQIIEGQFQGRKVWSRLMLEHSNPTAVQIGRAQLSAICRAVGIMRPSDSTELHNLPLVIRVAIRRRADTGETVNEIKAYSPHRQQPPASIPSTPPWKRGG